MCREQLLSVGGEACFLCYSNGPNLLATVIQLNPDAVRCAILLRGSQFMGSAGTVDLSTNQVLMLAGRNHTMSTGLFTLPETLRPSGADVEVQMVAAGQEISAADVTEAARWLQQNPYRL